MGPLAGYRIVELAGIGPAPMACMLLADMGADIVRIDRVTDPELGIGMVAKYNLLLRGRRSVAVDLKQPDGVEVVLRLVEGADALIEGFRPGVMERLGLGPNVCSERNPKLVYGRMTGWGQDGPLAQAAGHDINYISLIGALHAIGRKGGPPAPPLNLVGDFGGGALYLVAGVLAAMLEAQKSGKGQIVDAAMVDGAASLMTIFYGMFAGGLWRDERGVNLLDSGSPFHEAYETSDGKYVSLAPIEAKFYGELLRLTGLENEELPPRMDPKSWPAIKQKIAGVIKTKTRDEWREALEGTDVCFAPVMSLAEAPKHPHNQARETFIERDGVVQPAPAPRFSRTVSQIQCPPAEAGAHTDAALADWGFAADEIGALRQSGAIA